MADLKKIVNELSKLSLMEAAELSKMLEEEWGVSAAMPAAVAAQSTAVDGGATAEEEQTSFDVILTGASNKIGAIKEVRAITGLSLGDAKALVEGAPKPVKEGVEKAEADELKQRLEKVGAQVELK